MRFKKFGKLPGKPSALIRLALHDLALVERSKKYRVDMGSWHMPWGQFDEKCAVCFAGSVMVKTLKCPIDKFFSAGSFANESAAFQALNHFRSGFLCGAFSLLGLRDLGGPMPKSLPDQMSVGAYETNPRLWRQQMRNVVKVLEKAGY